MYIPLFVERDSMAGNYIRDPQEKSLFRFF